MLGKTYPSIDLACPIAVSSYESMMKRFDALDTKIQNLMSFAITTFLIIPTIGNSKQLPFNSVLFILSALLLSASVGISIIARKSGKVVLLNPQELYDGWLDFDQIEFKKNIIFDAGKSFKQMEDCIERKWQLNLLSLLFYSAAVVAAAFWAAAVFRF